MKKKEKNKGSERVKHARIFDSCILGTDDENAWKVYSKSDGTILSQKAWKEIKVLYDYLYLIDDNDRYTLGWIKDNQLIILAPELKYIDWIKEDTFELTNEKHQKAICVKGDILIDYGRYKDFDYEVNYDSKTGSNHVEIIGLKIPRTVNGKNIVQESEKGYVVKDGDDYAFYDTNGEMVLDFEYQEMKLFDDHVEATKKIFFD